MSRDFKKEIDLLDETYTDIVEAIMNKPEVEDYERSRIYFENVVAHMNNWIENIKEVKPLVLSHSHGTWRLGIPLYVNIYKSCPNLRGGRGSMLEVKVKCRFSQASFGTQR